MFSKAPLFSITEYLFSEHIPPIEANPKTVDLSALEPESSHKSLLLNEYTLVITVHDITQSDYISI